VQSRGLRCVVLGGLLVALPVLSLGQSASVEPRAQQYWARRQAKDLTGAYPFYCSGYRSRVSQAQFLQLTRLVRFDLSDIRVVQATVSGDRAEVTIAYKFVAPLVSAQPLDGQAKETWVRDTDGQWCKEDEPVALPFPQSPSLPAGAAR